jgi:hypothetical protein
MEPEQYSTFRHEAVHRLKDLNKKCEEEFRISSWPRWDYDFDRGTLTFSQDGQPKVVASIQVVGTTSISGGTWLWGWANQHIPPCATQELVKVRSFGEIQKLSELTQAKQPDDEFLGWELTAVAAKVLGAKGAYRCPGENGFIYLIYSSLAFASDLPDAGLESNRLNCSTHGVGFTTYVCEHLLADPAQKWFSAEINDDNKWPDAWCTACDVFFQQEGEWNERNESKRKIDILCHHCYETLRPRQKPAATAT